VDGKSKTCCICGRVLPNRWAVAGRCEVDGCGAAFCALHWYNGSRKCPEHGWMSLGTSSQNGTTMNNDISNSKERDKMEERTDGHSLCAEAERSLTPEKKASILRQIGAFAVALGKGASALAKKLSGIKSTDEALQEIEAQIAENRVQREPVAKRYDELYRLIVAKKKLYQAAPSARKKILEMELKGAIAEYQSLERQMAAYLNNETILTKVKGRMCELVAMNLKSISEDQIDKLTDKIEDAADENENLDGAIVDLDKAGIRRERKDTSFEESLAAFDDDLTDVATAEAATSVTEPSGVGEKPIDIRQPTTDAF